MTPDMDAYWVGVFAATLAQVHHFLKTDQPGAMHVVEEALERFAESPVMDEQLLSELAPYWEPRREAG